MSKQISKKKYKNGQYFTTNNYLKECVNSLIMNKPSLILEPSVGRGDLIENIVNNNKNIKFDLYEIDKNIKLLDSISNLNVNYCDFLEYNIYIKYNTIIGNPPYVKIKNGNLYIEFIKKCYNLLNDNGEIIFIVPSDFIKLTSTSKLINIMMENGTFTHIIHPNKENLFKNASIDVIVFRYCKNKLLNNIIYVNNEKKILLNTNGILTYSDIDKKNYDKFINFFDIYVGVVSGKESVYKNNKYGNFNILTGKNKQQKYILIEKFPTDNEELNNYMNKNKNILINRRIRKFNEKNWYEWGALRNYKTIKNNIGKKCIYIHNMTRKEEVAFIDNVNFFGGNLLILIPKYNINIEKFVNYLNSDIFKKNYIYSGRFKIGHKQLCNCLFQSSNFI